MNTPEFVVRVETPPDGRSALRAEQLALPDFRAQTLSPFARYHQRIRPLPYHPNVWTVGTDPLLRRDGLKIWRDVGRDDMVRLALRLLTANIVTDFRVVPADDTAESKQVADAVAWMFENMPGGIVSKLGRVLKALLYGFSVSEVIYGIVSEGPFTGWVGIRDIEYRPPFFFDFVPDQNGKLGAIFQVDDLGHKSRQLDLDKALHYVWEGEENPFIGESLWRPYYPYWYAKQGFVKLGNIQAERYAGKLKVKQLDKTKIANKVFEAVAHVVLDDYQNATGVILPEGMDAEVMQGEADPETYQHLCQFCDKRALAVAGIPWLAVEEGLRSGSFALADVHLETMGTIHQNPQRDIESLLTEGPVRVMCRANWIAPRHWPRVALSPSLEKDKGDSVDRYLKIAAQIPDFAEPQDKNWLRARVGVEEVDESEDLGGGPLALAGPSDEARRFAGELPARTGPVAAGLAVQAEDTGRVLMLQRALVADDPAAGTWEFPGGKLALGESALDAARREWSEETGQPLPEGRIGGTWTSANGVYQGFLWLVPREIDIKLNIPADEREVQNPDWAEV